MAVVHDFAYSLDQSFDVPLDWWERMYRILFIDFHSMTELKADGIAQRAGIDRMITLTTGKVYAVDEKVRQRDYGDVLLEVYSDKDRKTPGWLTKESWCDYIAYATPSVNKCFLLPVPQLKAAWRKHGPYWMQRYPKRDAQNRGWITQNIAIPYDELFSALDEALHAVPKQREPGEEG